MWSRRRVGLSLLVLVSLVGGCSAVRGNAGGGEHRQAPRVEAATGGEPPAPPPCADAVPSLDDDLSATLPHEPLGAILRCSPIADVPSGTVDAIARTSGYVGPPLPSGVRVLRIVYRTERGTAPPRPGFGSAVVLLPAAPRAARLPVVVVDHGTVGLAPSCPPSRESPTGDATYLAELGYPLAGAGYALILPDFAGYSAFGAPGNPIAGYHSAADEARSTLDAARALRSLRPAQFSLDVVLVGHSQGGHAALGALALHETYGSGGHLAGVVAFAPSWFSMASFGAMLALPSSFPTKTDADTVAASVWYHYSHAELLEGPGAGVVPFRENKRAAVDAFVRTACDPQGVAKLGKDTGEIFDPGFVSEVSLAAALDLPCATDRCRAWVARYAEDRPHLAGAALAVPILLVHGDADDWIPPERARCGFDRLKQDGAAVTFCVVPGAKHDPVVGMRSDYAARWVAFRTLGGPDPGACGGADGALHGEGGGEAVCASPPPNH